MNEPIGVGDLVVVVRWPCCGKGLGNIFRVGLFANGLYGCSACGAVHPSPLAVSKWGPEGFSSPPQWLKRIPPLSDLEGARDYVYIESPQGIPA